MSVRKFEPWANTECDCCFSEFQVTRTEAREIKGPVICNDCAMYKQGYNDAMKELKKKPETPTIEIDHFQKQTIFSWVCPKCKSIETIFENPKSGIDFVLCDKCSSKIKVIK